MHSWGDDVDWPGIDDACRYIGENLRRWGRVGVTQYKEKYGTVRVYLLGGLGWHSFHNITHPGHCFSRYPKWLWSFDCRVGRYIVPFCFNWIIVPYNKWLYRKLYSNMVKKYPHLREEILCMADIDELLKGL